MANMQRVSAAAAEAALEAKCCYDRAMRGGQIRAGSVDDVRMRRALRASVARAELADRGAVLAVRALRRAVDLSGSDEPLSAA